MAITSVGTGSGLQLESLITDIINAEKAPVESRLNAREAKVQASISALGSLKSSLADFQTALGKLKNASAFTNRTATASDTTLFSATTASSGSTAELGSYAIGVVQMAKTQKLASANFASPSAAVGSGSLNIAVGGSSFNVDVTAGTSLTGLRDAINNANGNAGVRASLLTVSDGAGGTATKLVMTSTKSGSEGAISVNVTDADGNNTDNNGLSRLRYDAADPAFDPADPAFEAGRMTASSPAQDAIITVDGFEVRSNSNVFANTIPGVTLTILKEAASGEDPLSGELNVGENKSGIKSAIEGFVTSYNALNGVFRQLIGVSADGETRGLMAGDSSLNVAQSRLRSLLGDTVEGASSGFNSLSALGINPARDGSISLDAGKLDSALANNFGDLSKLFSGPDGLATKLDKNISTMTGSGGMFAVRQESLGKQLDEIDDQRVQLAARLEKVEARYRSQFSALDILVSQFDQTGKFLSQQLEATAQIINNKK